MGRPRKHRRDLPERVYFEDGRYRYRPKEGKPIELGRAYGAAMAAWAKIFAVPERSVLTMGELGDEYMRLIAPKKAPRTCSDNIKEWAKLRPAFADMLPSEVTPQDVYRYMQARGARVRANREKALLSHMLTYGVYKGLIPTNPLYGAMRRDMIGHGERPRRRLPTDRELELFKSVSSDLIRCYVDLKELTGMRKGDILTLTEASLTDEGIRCTPRKGMRWDADAGERVGHERLFTWSPELRAAVDRVLTLKRRAPRRRGVVTPLPRRRQSPYLFATRAGASYYDTDTARADGFDAIWKRYMAKARVAAAAQGWVLEHFTEHDIRAKAGTDAERAGQKGHKLLGNSEATFRRAYDRGVEVVEPLRKPS